MKDQLLEVIKEMRDDRSAYGVIGDSLRGTLVVSQAQVLEWAQKLEALLRAEGDASLVRAEGTDTAPQRFRAGDHVKHRPSQERWVLACDQDRDEVIPAGWPESIAKAADCELIKAATDDERLTMLTNASKTGSFRGGLAKRQLESEPAAVRAPQPSTDPKGVMPSESEDRSRLGDAGVSAPPKSGTATSGVTHPPTNTSRYATADEFQESSHRVMTKHRKSLERLADSAVRAPLQQPDFWRCKTCGCLWRDNHDAGMYPGTAIEGGSVSLASAKQTSCEQCEANTSSACEPLYRAVRAPLEGQKAKP